MPSSVDTKSEWNFPSNNYGQITGISDSGVETFNGTPIKSLAREICQNSIDAKLMNSEPVRVVFRTFEIERSAIPDFDVLQDAFYSALDFWSQQKSPKARDFFVKAIHTSELPKIMCLRISDFNTTGLLGSDEEYNSPWTNLIKSQGASDKSGSTGGSFGIGKFAPYACSVFRTVFYSTLDMNGIVASQGVARITSFKDKNGDITQGTGYFGADKNTPVHSQLNLDSKYPGRDSSQSGTDIYILGFNSGDEWKNEMVASVLDGFLYAVYKGELIVEVDDVIINQENLDNLINSNTINFNEKANNYYKVLVASEEKAPYFKKTIDDYGDVHLHLMIEQNLHRRVAMVRKTGMKIMDKGKIDALLPFAGVLYIEGVKLNEFLRSLENPQHTKWEVDRADNKAKARRVLESLTKFIKESLNSLKNDDSAESIDAPVGEFLPDEPDGSDVVDDRKSEQISNTIRSIEVIKVKHNPKGNKTLPTGDNDADINNSDGLNTDVDAPGDGVGPAAVVGSGNNQTATDGGSIPEPQPKAHIPVRLSKIRFVCLKKEHGEYAITLTPSISATNGHIELFLSGESYKYPAEIISARVENSDKQFQGNKIIGLMFTEMEQIRLIVKINYYDYCSMEVKAYGN